MEEVLVESGLVHLSQAAGGMVRTRSFNAGAQLEQAVRRQSQPTQPQIRFVASFRLALTTS